MADKKLSLIFWALVFADAAAFLAEGLREWRTTFTYDSSPLEVQALFWLMGVAAFFAVVFQPDKEIGWSRNGITIGRAPIDDRDDWITLGAWGVFFFAIIELTLFVARL
jgi:hypothetical protein